MRVNKFVPNQEIFQNGVGSLNKIGNKETSESKVYGSSFGETLKSALDKVNDKQIEASDMTTSFIKGDDVEISDVMLAGEEAKLSLQFAVQVRNKLVEAYKELSQMQL